MNIGTRVRITNNGGIYPGFESMAKKLHAKFWIRDFYPPNGCVGIIANYEHIFYLVRFNLFDIIESVRVSNFKTDKYFNYFNYQIYYKFLDSKRDNIDVVMQRGFEIIKEEEIFEPFPEKEFIL